MPRPFRTYTFSSFKNTFKVGDLLYGHREGYYLLITAIGETRFVYRKVQRLGKDLHDEGVYETSILELKERVLILSGNYSLETRRNKSPTPPIPTF